MRSSDAAAPDDRTVRARVRDAAIDLIATEGLEALTARAVAERAGVSPGSVINNYGSMAGLREACDAHVTSVIRVRKTEAMTSGGSLDLVAALREADGGSLIRYLTAVLAEDSPAVAHLVDELVADSADYLEAGVEAGSIRPSRDPHARAVVLTLSSLGSLVMHRHLTRLLGVDLTAAEPDPGPLSAYAGPLYELYTHGLFTPEFGERATAALAALRAEPRPSPGPAGPTDHHQEGES